MSNFTRYLIICCVCIGVFIAGILTPAYDGAWFFAMQSLWSLLIIFIVLLIETSRLTFRISVIETLTMLLNLFAGIGYDDLYQSMDFFYEYYEIILYVLAGIELIVLTGGARPHGMAHGMEGIYSNIVNRFSNIGGTAQDWISDLRKKEK